MKRFGQIAKRIFIALCVMSAVCVIAWHYFGNHENSAATEEKSTAGVLVEKQEDEPMTDEAKAEDAAGGTVIPDDPAPDYVGFCDVRFFIENGERQRDTALYLNGKEAYVFLPSYADISNISIRLPDEVESLSIDGKQIGDGDTLGKLHTDEIYDLAVKLREEDKNSESDNGDAAAADSDSPDDAAANEDAVNTSEDEAADQTATDPWDTVLPVAETIEIPEEAQPLRTYDMYQLTFMQSENLPALYIDTENGTMDYLNQDKTHWEPGEMVCLNEDGTLDSEGEIRKIHGRGSASWGKPQKGYKFDLRNDSNLLGMDNARKWILVANSWDSTRIRNAISYSFMRDLGLQYAIDYEFCDVYFNNQYNGNYILCEAIEIANNRIDPDRVDSLIKIDRIADDSNWFSWDYGSAEILYPKNTSDEFYYNIRKKMNYAFTKIKACKNRVDYEKIKEIIDIDSFAKMYLINEVIDELDNNYLSTFYYYNESENKIYAGPGWDMDKGFGNELVNRGRYYDFNSYADGPPEFLMEADGFNEDVLLVMLEHEEAFDNILKNIDIYSKMISKSHRMSKIRFPFQADGCADYGNDEYNIQYLKDVAYNRIKLIKDTVRNPRNYHRIRFNGSVVYWLKAGETIPDKIIDYACERFGWQYVIYVNGGRFLPENIITTDLSLTGKPIASETADLSTEIEDSETEPSSTDEQPAAVSTTVIQEQSTEKGDIIMALLGIILLATPGIISLMICGDLRDIKKSKIPGLIAEYLVFEFLTFLISYGIITILKGSVTISFAGISRGETYTIFHSNVVFLMAALFLTSSVALGLLKPYYDYAKAGLIKRLPSPDVLDRVITKGQLSDENTSKKET